MGCSEIAGRVREITFSDGSSRYFGALQTLSGMQLALPVRWNAAAWPWGGLRHRVMLRCRKFFAVDFAFGLEVPKPVLARFEAANDGVVGFVGVMPRMLSR